MICSGPDTGAVSVFNSETYKFGKTVEPFNKKKDIYEATPVQFAYSSSTDQP